MPRAPRKVVRAVAARPRTRRATAAAAPLKLETVELDEDDAPGGSRASDPAAHAPQTGRVAMKAETGANVPVKTEIFDEPSPKLELADNLASPGVIDVEDAWQPVGWQRILDGVRAMRAKREAPVDSMGCERVGEKDQATLDAPTVRYQHLVALMLSSQTRDEVTAAAVDRLRAALDPTLTPEAVVAASESRIAELIYPVGFYRRKAVYLQAAAQICIDRYGGDIPRTIEEITQLPGVGPKMGHLLLQSAWGEVHGIGVDVHVHRLANLWGWVPRPTRTPEQTRTALEAWLPRELWREINPLLVGFGQTWCPSRASAKTCAQCELGSACPSRKR